MNYQREPEEDSLINRVSAAFRGNRTTEYGMLISVVAVIVLIAFTWLGYELFHLFTEISNSVPTDQP